MAKMEPASDLHLRGLVAAAFGLGLVQQFEIAFDAPGNALLGELSVESVLTW